MAGQGSRSAMLGLLGTVAVVLLSCIGATAATTYQVGNTSWTLAPSNDATFYDDWSAKQQFFVGDVIEFKYVNTSHNVYSLNTSAAFDICNFTQAILKDTSGDFKLELNTAGTKWYACQFASHCEEGMKVKIVVLEAGSGPSAGPADAPGALQSAAPRLATAIGYGTTAAVVISAASFFL